MADIGVEIEGIRGLQLKFDQFPERAREHLYENIAQIIHRLYGAIRSEAPSRSGALRSHIAESMSQGTNYVRGNVRFTGEYAKAGALNYGAHRKAAVRAHEMRLDHVFGSRLSAPMTVIVDRFDRKPNLASRNFITGPARSMHDEAMMAIQEAIEQAIGEDQS